MTVEALLPYRHPVQTAPARPMPAQLREKLQQWKRERAEKPDRAWMALPDERRAQLVCLLTERNPASAHLVRWSDLTEAERIIIGVEIRGFLRDLAAVAPVLAAL